MIGSNPASGTHGDAQERIGRPARRGLRTHFAGSTGRRFHLEFQPCSCKVLSNQSVLYFICRALSALRGLSASGQSTMKRLSKRPSLPTIVDIFSGVGGLSLGAARAGFNVAGAVELDPHPSSAHRKNFPHAEHLEQDIGLLSGNELKKRLNLKHIDGIVGGPPCQGFSSIGHRNMSDPRNLLFVQFFRMVQEVKPKFFMAENVPGILASETLKIREIALAHVEDDYEVLAPIRLVASSFGVPTTRERIFFIGYRKAHVDKLVAGDFVPPKDVTTTTVNDALAGLPTKIDPDWQTEENSWKRVDSVGSDFFATRLHNCRPKGVGDPKSVARLRNKLEVSGFLGTKHCREVIRRFAKVEPGMKDTVSKCVRLKPDGLCPTLRAGTDKDHGSFQAVRPLHPTEDRVITPREGARLQGFPDWFQFAPTKWHSFRQLGNSVSPILAECVLRVIHRAVEG